MNSHRSVFEHSNTPSQVGDHLRRSFPLFRYASSELSSVLLNVLDVSLEFSSEFLKVLNNGAFDSLGEVGMVIGDQASTFTLFRVAM